MEINALLEKIDERKNWIEKRRPLAPEEVKQLDAYFRIDMTYSSNALEDAVLQLHRLFYQGIDADKAGVYRDVQVFITGTEYIPPKAKEIPVLMKAFVDEINNDWERVHPVMLAALAHRKLVDIQPFKDGNSRTSRLLMNLILINRGYQIIIIPPVLRTEYINALKAAQREKQPSDEAFLLLIAECEIEAQRDFCRMFNIKPPQKNV